MQRTKVGVSKFRRDLTTYLYGESSVAITRRGKELGVFYPLKPVRAEEPQGPPLPPRKPLSDEQWEAFRIAGEKLQAQLKASGVTEDELIEDFERLRKERRKRQTP